MARVKKGRRSMFLDFHYGICGSYVDHKVCEDNKDMIIPRYVAQKEYSTTLSWFLDGIKSIFSSEKIEEYPMPIHKDCLITYPNPQANGVKGQVEEYTVVVETPDGKADMKQHIFGKINETIKDYRLQSQSYQTQKKTTERQLQRVSESEEKRKSKDEKQDRGEGGFNPFGGYRPPMRRNYFG